jgi:tight adherence protein B
MSENLIYLLYVAAFLAGFLLVEGLYHLIADSRQSQHRAVNRRMRMMEAGATTLQVVELLRRKSLSSDASKRPTTVLEWLDGLIAQAGLTISTWRMLALMGAVGILGFIAADLFTVQIGLAWATPLSMAGGIGIGIAVPVLWLVRLKRQRLVRFGEQLPDALDIMVRSLRVGHPIGTGIALVAKDMPDPIGSMFGIAVDEMTYGLDLFEALENMNRYVDHPDLRFMIVAMRIHHGTGGNLAEILDGLSQIIRDRFRMYRKIRALSAAGRMSATLLSILPFAVMAGMWAVNRQYYADFVNEPAFIISFSLALALLLIGIIVIRRLVQFRV